VTGIRNFTLLSLAIGFGLALMPARSSAQWWKHAPRDFEECSDSAERTATSKEANSKEVNSKEANSKEVLASLLSECEAKFAGRRKPGGGYTYYDFMQNQHFDIAGPNPTSEELKQIDEQYTEFLDRRKHSIIAAALIEKQKQLAEVALARQQRPATEKIPIPVSRPPVRAKTADCNDHSISCGWSRFATKIQNFKKTLLGPAKKTTPG
jgi:hypothetical protein